MQVARFNKQISSAIRALLVTKPCNFFHTLKIFNKLEKKGLCDQWVINKKRECDKKNNYFKVCFLNDLGKDLCIYLNALKSNKPTKKD
ncbi:hypothetical protein [Helicobacter pylori]|uniref:hypothetical protein n=1 Tax=Helicobacter pylori TaxID=210 RepID=UPI003465BFB0